MILSGGENRCDSLTIAYNRPAIHIIHSAQHHFRGLDGMNQRRSIQVALSAAAARGAPICRHD
jgi:hypothetical protein